MSQSEPVITLDSRDKLAKSFSAFQNDRPYPRFGRLSEAPGMIMTNAAGCIASTPRDMGLYVQMIANHGKGAEKHIALRRELRAFLASSHQSRRVWSHCLLRLRNRRGYAGRSHHLAPHRRHGLFRFSAMHVDIDQGVGAFASINAMQGYRPQPVVQYAIQLMRAKQGKHRCSIRAAAAGSA